MINRHLLVIALILFVQSIEIQKVNQCPGEEAFPEFNLNTNFKTDVSNSSNSTSRTQIFRVIKNWEININSNQVSNENSSPLDPYSKPANKCQASTFFFRQSVTQISRADYDGNNLLPGTLIQMMDPTNYARGIIPVYLNDAKRNPLTIQITNGLKATLENVTNQASYKEKLSNFLLKATPTLNDQPIQVYVQQAARLEKVLKRLGLSSKIYEDLQIAGSSPDRLKIGSGKIVVVLFQKLFSASLDLSPAQNQTLSTNLVETVFSAAYTFDEFAQSCSYGYWRTGNLPQVIAQSNYGRLLILSIDDNFINQKMIDRFNSCFSKGKLLSNSCIDASMSEIQKVPTLRYYIGGIDETVALQRNGNMPVYKDYLNWKKVFYNFQDAKTIGNLRPLSAKMYNLLGKKYTETQTRYFPVMTCIKEPEISIVIQKIESECWVKLKKTGDNDFDKLLFNTNRAQTYEIGSASGWQPFEVKITVKGNKKGGFWFIKKAAYPKELRFSIVINGRQVFKNAVGNSRDNSQFRDYFFKIDPIKETVR